MNARIAQATAKYFDGGCSGHVTIGREGFGFRTKYLVLDSDIRLEAEALAADAYASADQAALRIEKRLRRYKRRLKDHQGTRSDGPALEQGTIVAPSYVIAAPEADSDQEMTNFDPVITAETTTAPERLSVRGAVMQLDLTGVPVPVFRHAGHDRLNLVYRRPDGHIGWLDPPPVEARDAY